MNKHKIKTLVIAIIPSILVIIAKYYSIEISLEEALTITIPFVGWLIGETNVDAKKVENKAKSLDAIIQPAIRKVDEILENNKKTNE